MNRLRTIRLDRLSAAVLTAAVLLLPIRAVAQSTITLRPDARVEAGSAVTLADVAVLEGSAAESLGATVIETAAATRPGEPPVVEVRHVRAALERAGVDWATVSLRGSSCTLHQTSSGRRTASGTVQTLESGSGVGVGAATVRDAVLEKIGHVVGVGPEDLRVGFDDGDGPLLATPSAGKVVEVRPLGSSERMPLSVTIYEGERIVASGTVRASVLVRREVAVVANAKARGEVIDAADVSLHEQWMGANARPAPLQEVVGSAARSRLRVGATVLDSDIETPVVVEKGDLVAIHCVSGSVVLRTMGRALAAGRDGEVVRFEALEPTRERGPARTFFARMSGRGRAVAMTGPQPAGTTFDTRDSR